MELVLKHGLKYGDELQTAVTLKELTTGDLLEAQLSAEKLVFDGNGNPSLVNSPALFGYELLRRQIGKIGAPRVIAGGRHVGQVVGHHVQVGLLRDHAGGGDGKGLHVRSSDLHSGDFEIGGDDLVADGDGGLQRLLGTHDGIDHLAGRRLALDGFK